MRQWYAFHAKRLTRHFRPMKIEFQSCSFPGFGPKGRAVKGRDTKGLFLVRLANDTDDGDEVDEESLLPPLHRVRLHKDKLHKDRLHKDKLHKDKTCGGEPGSSSHTKVLLYFYNFGHSTPSQGTRKGLPPPPTHYQHAIRGASFDETYASLFGKGVNNKKKFKI